ncbi:hypothetical protein [Dendronalium sp. ChiSLP03b]|uniref:hypothetical protein n=1 Tax=Dendronalium sp. ChiSLP03b TaxID=3075381 RepID=UPI00391D3FA2
MTEERFDIGQNLHSMSIHLEILIESPEYQNLTKSDFYHPDFTLVNALQALQQALEAYDKMMAANPPEEPLTH